MGLTTTYLVKSGDLKGFLETVKNAQAPDKFSNKFLQDLGYASSNDRLYIGMLKSLGFIDSNSIPTSRYYNFLDPGQSDKMLKEGILEAYEDLFAVNNKSYELPFSDVKGKLKALTQGTKSDSVYGNMARTFKALTDLINWNKLSGSTVKSAPVKKEQPASENQPTQKTETITEQNIQNIPEKVKNGLGLHYNIQIHLPATRDVSVYDAIFQSLKKHLIND